MHTFFKRSLTTTVVTLAFAGAAFASQASKPASSSPAPSKSAAASTVSKAKANTPAVHSAMGTIEKYDANTLTLKTASGEEQFTLAGSARVRNGSHAIKADELSGLTGQRAKVRYTEANGQRTAESVMVSSGHRGAARSKTTKR